MTYTLPPLPYATDALAPHISENTLNFHYGKHHQAYVDNLNKLVAGTPLENADLETVIRSAAKKAIGRRTSCANRAIARAGRPACSR